MKKWKIVVKKDRQLTVFLTEESLYFWISEGARQCDLSAREIRENTHTLSLKKGDELYVEWLGSEYVYDDKTDTTHTLKSVKFTTVKSLTGSWTPMFIDNLSAWISDDVLQLDVNTNDVEKSRTRKSLSISRCDDDIVNPSEFNVTLSVDSFNDEQSQDAKIE